MSIEEITSPISIDDGMIMKTIITEGQGKSPIAGSDVTVHYVGTLHADGNKFDSSHDRASPFTFKLGEGRVIKGWDVGVATMKIGEKALLTIKSEYAYGVRGSPPKIPGGATLDFEVELLSWTNSTDVSGDGGVMKEVTTAGDAAARTCDDDAVVQATWSFSAELDGERVEMASAPATPQPLDLADPTLPFGLLRAVTSMKPRERAEIVIRSDYAYGEKGYKSADGAWSVPPNAALVYDITLVSAPPRRDEFELSFEARVELAKAKKAQGNAAVKVSTGATAVPLVGRLAAHRYTQCIALFDASDEVSDDDDAMTGDEKLTTERRAELVSESRKLKGAVYGNLAMLQLREKRYADVVESATHAMDEGNTSVKVLYRRAQAHALSGADDAVELALADLKAAKELEPDNKDVLSLTKQVHRRVAAQKAKQRKLFGGFFGKVSLVSDAEIAASNAKTAAEVEAQNRLPTPSGPNGFSMDEFTGDQSVDTAAAMDMLKKAGMGSPSADTAAAAAGGDGADDDDDDVPPLEDTGTDTAAVAPAAAPIVDVSFDNAVQVDSKSPSNDNGSPTTTTE